MPSTSSPNKGYELMATGENDGTWGIKTNANLSTIDLNLGGRLSVSLAVGNVTLSGGQEDNLIFTTTGALAAATRKLIFPSVGGFYIIRNTCTGGTVQVDTAAVSPVTIPTGAPTLVYCDGTAMRIVSPVSIWGGTAGGTANAITITPTVTPVSHAAGMTYDYISGAAGNNGATTLDDGAGAVAVVTAGNVALAGGEIPANTKIRVVFDGTAWRLDVAGATVTQVQNDEFQYVQTVGGTADVITLTPSQAISSYAVGQRFKFIAGGATTVTGPTVTVSGIGAKNIVSLNNTALPIGAIKNTEETELVYDGTSFRLVGATGLRGQTNSWKKPQAQEPVAVAYGASLALDFSSGASFDIGTLTGNIDFINPTAATVGQSGRIYLKADATGGRTIGFSGNQFYTDDGATLSFNVAASAKNVVYYDVLEAGVIYIAAGTGLAT